MFPALLAAKPLVRYGVMIGVPVALLLVCIWRIYSWGYGNGHDAAEEVYQSNLATQINEMSRQVVAAKEMESKVVREHTDRTLQMEQQFEAFKRKVAEDAKTTPAIPLSRRTLARYDELRRMSNDAAPRVPAASPGPGPSAVQPGEVQAAPTQLIQVTSDDGEHIGLTTIELGQAVTDIVKKLAECKSDYAALSAFNDGREDMATKE